MLRRRSSGNDDLSPVLGRDNSPKDCSRKRLLNYSVQCGGTYPRMINLSDSQRPTKLKTNKVVFFPPEFLCRERILEVTQRLASSTAKKQKKEVTTFQPTPPQPLAAGRCPVFPTIPEHKRRSLFDLEGCDWNR
ncbi:unnamed protein product [Larinioides sclopetarius]|uniref:Uncharacterized protein n=1 Tax=Larinioides sclopetarius TaxID=280406 RepID=A0AAV1ZFE1_9ARAC